MARLTMWPQFSAEDIDAVVAHIRGEDLSAYEVDDGPLLAFEWELAARYERAHALLVSSGTSALQSALFALEIGPDAEVLVPTCTHPASAAPVLHAGATLRFVDVDPDTGNPSAADVAAGLSERTRAVVVAHSWGMPADVAGIRNVIARSDASLVEDCARAPGARMYGRPAGAHGAAAVLSFHEQKLVPGGEGGALLVSDRRHYERAVVLGHAFRCRSPLHLTDPELAGLRESGLGLNFKIHPLAAVLARRQFDRLEERVSAATANYARLDAALEGVSGVRLIPPPRWADAISPYGFNLLWDATRDSAVSAADIAHALETHGVPASVPGHGPLHRLALFRNPQAFGLAGRVVGPLADEELPAAAAHHSRVVRLRSLYERDSPGVEAYASAVAAVASDVERAALVQARSTW